MPDDAALPSTAPLHVGADRIVTERIAGLGTTPGTRTIPGSPGHPAAPDEPPTVFTGTAAQLCPGLWNRGTEITATGRTWVLDRWREVQRVRWS